MSNNASCKRSVIDSSCTSPPKKKKRKLKRTQEENDISSSDLESDPDDIIQSIELVKTPTFNGRRLTTAAATDSPVNNYIDKDNYFKVIEKKYLMPLLIGQERLETMMKSLYKNQTKIQKALMKRQV